MLWRCVSLYAANIALRQFIGPVGTSKFPITVFGFIGAPVLLELDDPDHRRTLGTVWSSSFFVRSPCSSCCMARCALRRHRSVRASLLRRSVSFAAMAALIALSRSTVRGRGFTFPDRLLFVLATLRSLTSPGCSLDAVLGIFDLPAFCTAAVAALALAT